MGTLSRVLLSVFVVGVLSVSVAMLKDSVPDLHFKETFARWDKAANSSYTYGRSESDWADYCE